MHFRRFHKWWAESFGYFWLPCPLCGKEFGGHEWTETFFLHRDRGNSSIASASEPHRGTGICPDCTKAGKGNM